jgi:hypothetical protein
MTLPKPQDTGCTTIEIDTGDDVLDEGVTNGIVTMIRATRNVRYDDERDAYIVGDKHDL